VKKLNNIINKYYDLIYNIIFKMSQSNAEDVKQFTEGASGIQCPDKPTKMNKESVQFIIRMVMSELHELACTVTDNRDDSLDLMKGCLGTIDECKNYDYPNEVTLIGAQADSMVDAWYYMLNTAAKHGMNLSKLFDVVHASNMAKRDPNTGQFIRRESDGKIIKPDGWQPPNIDEEILRQFREGSWN